MIYTNFLTIWIFCSSIPCTALNYIVAVDMCMWTTGNHGYFSKGHLNQGCTQLTIRLLGLTAGKLLQKITNTSHCFSVNSLNNCTGMLQVLLCLLV